MPLPPNVIRPRCPIASPLDPAKERFAMLTDAVASPHVRFVHINLIVETVVHGNICAGRPIDAGHDFDKIRSVAAVAFAYIQYEQIGVYHFVLQVKQPENDLKSSHANVQRQNVPAMFRSNCVAFATSTMAHSIVL